VQPLNVMLSATGPPVVRVGEPHDAVDHVARDSRVDVRQIWGMERTTGSDWRLP
jgi:hypothetical protein